LKGCIFTDKENYFLALHPVPFPEKPAGNKLKKDLELNLSDGNAYTLDHYDTRYIEYDTVMEMLFLINIKDLEHFLNFEVTEVKIDMKLHKSALKEELA
jgi:hypothetical protein